MPQGVIVKLDGAAKRDVLADQSPNGGQVASWQGGTVRRVSACYLFTVSKADPQRTGVQGTVARNGRATIFIILEAHQSCDQCFTAA